MRTRTRIHPYVTPDLARRLVAYSAAKGLTDSAVVQAALEEYLDGGEKDNVLIIRRLDRLGRAAIRLHRDVEVLSEAFAVFVRIWSAYAPKLSQVEWEEARRRGAKYYESYLEALSAQFASGSRLVNAVVKEDAEPTNVGRAAESPATPKGPAR
jgi:hypothetical protein